MKTYIIATSSIYKLYFSMFLSAIISFILPYFIIPLFLDGSSAIFGVFFISFIVLFFLGIRVSKQYVNSKIYIQLSDEEITLKNEKLFNLKLKNIRKYYITYTNTNFPWFKILTYDNKHVKFNCKDKGDEVFNEFVHQFVKAMEGHDSSYKIK